MFSHTTRSSSNHINDLDSSWEETVQHSHTDSPSSSMMCLVQRRMRRTICRNKFQSLARQEQRQLREEIKTCKNYVRTLQNSYKIRQHAKETSIMEVFARDYATDLSEEIQLCEEELKYEDTMHALDCPRRRAGVHRDCSCQAH
jgi:hypothetical protein